MQHFSTDAPAPPPPLAFDARRSSGAPPGPMSPLDAPARGALPNGTAHGHGGGGNGNASAVASGLAPLRAAREELFLLVQRCVDAGVDVRDASGDDVLGRLTALLDAFDVGIDTAGAAIARGASLPPPHRGSNDSVASPFSGSGPHAFGAPARHGAPASAVPSPSGGGYVAPVQLALRETNLSTIPTVFADDGASPAGSMISPTAGALSPNGRRGVRGGRAGSVSWTGNDAGSAGTGPTDARSPGGASGTLDADGGEVTRWLSHTYSGYGSFRQMAKEQRSLHDGVIVPYLNPAAEGMPALDLSVGAQGPRSAFSRPQGRHTAVYQNCAHYFDEVGAYLRSGAVPYMPEILTSSFDVLALAAAIQEEAQGTLAPEQVDHRAFVTVALNVLLNYSFVARYQLNVPRLCAFVEAVGQLYSPANPLHGALHAADTLVAAHLYISQPGVKENFSDMELLSFLFSALVADAGHTGATNDFLARVSHPLVRLFSDTCPSESFAVALAFRLLDDPALNFFAGSAAWMEDALQPLAFRELVTEMVVGTAPKFHAQQLADVRHLLRDGFVHDCDVPRLLTAVLHAATLSYAVHPLGSFLAWVGRASEERFRQGDEERRRGLAVSPLCDRTAPNVVQAQIGLLTFVIAPLFSALATVAPKEWTEALEANAFALSGRPGVAAQGSGSSPDVFALEGTPASASAAAALLTPTKAAIVTDAQIPLPPSRPWTDPTVEATPSAGEPASPTSAAAASGGSLRLLLPLLQTSRWDAAAPEQHALAFVRLFAVDAARRASFDEFGSALVALALRFNAANVSSAAKAALAAAAGSSSSSSMGALSREACGQLAAIIATTEAPPSAPAATVLAAAGGADATNPFLLHLLAAYPGSPGGGGSGGSSSGLSNTGGGVYATQLGSTATPHRNSSSLNGGSAALGAVGGSAAARWAASPIENDVYRRQSRRD